MPPANLPVSSSTARRIFRKIGTPVYVYSEKELVRNLRSFQKAFPGPDNLVCYSLKANPNAAVCRVFSRMGAGADVVSGGELWRALRAGFPAGKMVFSGVGKTEEELALAVKTGILMINVESMEEMLALEKVAGRLKKKASFSVRINPDVDPHTHKYITTGKLGTKFGVSPREALSMYERAGKSRWLQITGMQSHLGSQISSVKPYSMALAVMLKLFDRLEKRGIGVKILDIGGGWAVPEDGIQEAPAILAKAILPGIKSRGLRLVIEPGRSLVASAGVLLTRVLYRKTSGNRTFVIVDAAMNDLIRPLLYSSKHPVVSFSPGKGRKARLDIVGPICESGDFLAKDIYMRVPERGTALAVLSAGAYGFSMSSQYNSRPRAAEVMVNFSGNEWKVIRKRETLSDLIRGEAQAGF